MGNDLYWYKKPEPERPKECQCSDIKYILMDLLGVKDDDELTSVEITEKHLPIIQACMVGLKEGGKKDAYESMKFLASGITRHKSVLLTIHG